VLLLLCAAYFAVAETSFASCSRIRIRNRAEKGDAKAVSALWVLDHFDRAISTILIGTNIVHISTASIVTVTVTRLWGLSWVTLSTIVTTIVVFFFGEMLPKSVAKKYPERLALLCTPSLRFFMKLFRPLSALLTRIGQAAASLTHGDDPVSVTEDELYNIIEDMTEEGSLDEEQSDLISSALQFGNVTTESVLTPRVDVVAVDITDPPEKILDLIRSQNHSRLPVYEGSIDNIVGVLQIRRYLRTWLKEGSVKDLKPLLDEALFVHQSTNIDELLRALSERHLYMAIVTDNYGGTLGIVTVENILEELVGEIWDEDDVAEEPILTLPDGSILADADEHVEDVFDYMDYEDPEDNEELVNTLMGEWAYEQFVEIPKPGASFRYHDLKVIVASVEHNRIRKLRVIRQAPSEDKGGENA